jgi:adenylylsulfate kinase-like enzyme
MSNEKIHVTISGPSGAGKTTIARVIAEALKKAGFDAKNIDGDAKNREAGLFPSETDRLRRFAEGRAVTVLTANTTRQAIARSEKAQARPIIVENSIYAPGTK